MRNLTILQKYLIKYENDLTDSEKNKLKKNPLRLLDTKNKNCVIGYSLSFNGDTNSILKGLSRISASL